MKDLHIKYNEFKLEPDIANMIKNGYTRMGTSLRKAKCLMFCDENGVNNQTIYEYVGMSSERQPDEEYEIYKMRRKMSNDLLKYKKFIYSF